MNLAWPFISEYNVEYFLTNEIGQNGSCLKTFNLNSSQASPVIIRISPIKYAAMSILLSWGKALKKIII